MLEATGEGRYRMVNAGRVSKLNPDGKTGQIRMDDGAEEVFFHRSALVGAVIAEISKGDPVVFAVQSSPRPDGLRYATHIRRSERLVEENRAPAEVPKRRKVAKPDA